MKRLLFFIINVILVCIIIGCNNNTTISSFINIASSDIVLNQDSGYNNVGFPFESKIDGCALLFVGHNAFGEFMITKNGGFITNDVWDYGPPMFIKKKYTDLILKYIESIYFTDGKFDSEFSKLNGYMYKDIFADSIDSFVLTLIYYENGKRAKPKWEAISICTKDSTNTSNSNITKLMSILNDIGLNYSRYCESGYYDTITNPHDLKI